METLSILVCGGDGYLGWPYSLHMARRGHEVCIADNFSRRHRVNEVGSWSATPIEHLVYRVQAANDIHDFEINYRFGDFTVFEFVEHLFHEVKPDVIMHLGEIPSAPYSMISPRHATDTIKNNEVGTINLLWCMRDICPESHMVKLGTMGEYGTPDVRIPEGYFDLSLDGRIQQNWPFPRRPGSIYHATKVNDSTQLDMLTRFWDLKATDIHQGVVHGISTEEITEPRLYTRFDFDEIWGTVINRYCAQVIIGHPLRPYGAGGQTRGFIALRDSIQCLRIVSENPPKQSGYLRALNQFDETYSVQDLAIIVKEEAEKAGLDSKIENIDNPRIEAEKHFYEPDHEKLYNLGFKPTFPLREEIQNTFSILQETDIKQRINTKKHIIDPKVMWRP